MVANKAFVTRADAGISGTRAASVVAGARFLAQRTVSSVSAELTVVAAKVRIAVAHTVSLRTGGSVPVALASVAAGGPEFPLDAVPTMLSRKVCRADARPTVSLARVALAVASALAVELAVCTVKAIGTGGTVGAGKPRMAYTGARGSVAGGAMVVA